MKEFIQSNNKFRLLFVGIITATFPVFLDNLLLIGSK